MEDKPFIDVKQVADSIKYIINSGVVDVYLFDTTTGEAIPIEAIAPGWKD